MRRPLFRPDPGWLWLIAGLVVVFVATVVPAQLALERDRVALRQLQASEARSFELLAAHDRFLADLREGHPPLLRRLAGSNLNRMPADHEAVLIAESIDDHPIRWLEASIPPATAATVPSSPSLLEALVSGRGRLWMVAAGVAFLFVGLMLGPLRSVRERRTMGEGRSSTGEEATSIPVDRVPDSRWGPVPTARRLSLGNEESGASTGANLASATATAMPLASVTTSEADEEDLAQPIEETGVAVLPESIEDAAEEDEEEEDDELEDAAEEDEEE
ncbi:MAG: hypothetical protein ACO3P9_11840, partial [Phycisphaerales bacterium]